MGKPKKLKIVCDAACRIANANIPGRSGKGKSACGILFLDENDNPVDSKSYYLGEMTPPQAEYNALIKALDDASQYCRNDLEIWLDSELVVRQLNGQYAIRSENMKPLYDKVRILEKRYIGEIKYYHHSRNAKLAKQADKLANDEIDRKMSP